MGTCTFESTCSICAINQSINQTNLVISAKISRGLKVRSGLVTYMYVYTCILVLVFPIYIHVVVSFPSSTMLPFVAWCTPRGIY